MNPEKWLIHPGETRVIDLEDVRALKVGLAGGQIDIVAHDDPGARIEVHAVTIKDLRISAEDGKVEIDHPQLRWDNFLEVFRNFGSSGPKAEISVAVPREVALTLGVVSASALVSDLHSEARVNTVSGDVIVDGLQGDLVVNAVSGDVQARDERARADDAEGEGDVARNGDADLRLGATRAEVAEHLEEVVPAQLRVVDLDLAVLCGDAEVLDGHGMHLDPCTRVVMRDDVDLPADEPDLEGADVLEVDHAGLAGVDQPLLGVHLVLLMVGCRDISRLPR